MCIDDRWHEATSSATAEYNLQSPQDISVQVDSTSVMIIWSEQSIPNDKAISGYDSSCIISELSDGQIHEVIVPNVSASTTKVQVNGLLPGAAYKCCISAHILTNTPLDLISSCCITTRTKSLQEASNGLVIGLGTGLGICSLLLVLGMLVGFIVSKARCSKHDSTTQVFTNTKRYMHNVITFNTQITYYTYSTSLVSRPAMFMHNVEKCRKGWVQGYLMKSCIDLFTQTSLIRRPCKFTLDDISYRVTGCDEYNLVANPIYNISIKHTANNPQQETITSTTTTASWGDEVVMYEEVSNLHGNKPSTSVSDTPA